MRPSIVKCDAFRAKLKEGIRTHLACPSFAILCWLRPTRSVAQRSAAKRPNAFTEATIHTHKTDKRRTSFPIHISKKDIIMICLRARARKRMHKHMHMHVHFAWQAGFVCVVCCRCARVWQICDDATTPQIRIQHTTAAVADHPLIHPLPPLTVFATGGRGKCGTRFQKFAFHHSTKSWANLPEPHANRE